MVKSVGYQTRTLAFDGSLTFRLRDYTTTEDGSSSASVAPELALLDVDSSALLRTHAHRDRGLHSRLVAVADHARAGSEHLRRGS